MPIFVHLRNGRTEELKAAASCSWTPDFSITRGGQSGPRWLVCRDQRGEVIATYEEADVLGYRGPSATRARRFGFAAPERTAVS